MTRALVVAALVLTSCTASPTSADAKFWPAADFFNKNAAEVSFGGWLPAELVVKEGAPLTFHDGAQQGGAGFTIFPGVAEGESAPFFITEVWQQWPEPWVQPVWAPGKPLSNVFSVDVDSTFYSPFWRIEWLQDVTTQPRGGRDALKYPSTPGPLVLCPIVPEGIRFANDGTGEKDPATLDALPQLGPTLQLARGFVEGHDITYFDFGPNRFISPEAQRVEDARGYFFVDGEGKNLPIAAVLPADPKRHPLIERVNVKLPATGGVYVPSSRTALRAKLGDLAPLPSAANDGVSRLTMRAVVDVACFQAADFPAGCQWLDRSSAVEALTVTLLDVRPVYVTVVVP